MPFILQSSLNPFLMRSLLKRMVVVSLAIATATELNNILLGVSREMMP